MKIQDEKATLIQHCAVFGTLKTEVRKFVIGDAKPYAQYPVSVRISFVKPRERNGSSIMVLPDSHRFTTIERDGVGLYDSRADVPCDMTKWKESYRRNRATWLARQAEIDKENATAPAGVHREQMGNFRDEEPDAA
jgi:hypothetical protein